MVDINLLGDDDQHRDIFREQPIEPAADEEPHQRRIRVPQPEETDEDEQTTNEIDDDETRRIYRRRGPVGNFFRRYLRYVWIPLIPIAAIVGYRILSPDKEAAITPADTAGDIDAKECIVESGDFVEMTPNDLFYNYILVTNTYIDDKVNSELVKTNLMYSFMV